MEYGSNKAVLLFTRIRINGKSNISVRKYQNNAAVNTYTHLHASVVQYAHVTHSKRTQCGTAKYSNNQEKYGHLE